MNPNIVIVSIMKQYSNVRNDNNDSIGVLKDITGIRDSSTHSDELYTYTVHRQQKVGAVMYSIFTVGNNTYFYILKCANKHIIMICIEWMYMYELVDILKVNNKRWKCDIV